MTTLLETAADDRFTAGLAGDQLKAFRKLTEMLRGGARLAKLCGYAGTGKTFLLARLAAWADAEGFRVTVAAPTHKAAGVIEDKLDGLPVEVRTIHSLLGLRLEPDFENDTGGRILKAGDGKAKVKEGLVICDEASMVGAELKAHIDAMPGVRWLFVGDLAQLPPVGEAVSELLDDPDAVLEEVLRQAKGSEILNLATAIRGGDESLACEEGRDVFRVADAEALFARALERFDTDDHRRDTTHARMLVFRNARREALNLRMRQLLVGAAEPYVPGEWLVMYAAFSPTASRLNLMAEEVKNLPKGSSAARRAWGRFFDAKKAAAGAAVSRLHVSEEVTIRTVAEKTVSVAGLSFATWQLGVETRGGEEHVLPVLKPEAERACQEALAEAARLAKQARELRDAHDAGTAEWCAADGDRKAAWSIFYTLEESFAKVDYAYAMTVHKSQGSTFDHVFVDVPDLLSSGGMRNRILYTAVTRPSKSLTFYA